MINPKNEWTQFENRGEALEKLREFGLVTEKAKEIKSFMYKGIYTDEPVECKVVGYSLKNDYGVVIEVSGELHNIHHSYLKDMQRKRFELEF